MRVSTTAERLEAVHLRITEACRRAGRSPDEVTLVGVTKGFPPEAVREAAAAGLRRAENTDPRTWLGIERWRSR